MTVSGEGFKQPMNLKVKIGTRIDDIVNFCGGLKDDAAYLVQGGPMMGPTMISTDIYSSHCLMLSPASKSWGKTLKGIFLYDSIPVDSFSFTLK